MTRRRDGFGERNWEYEYVTLYADVGIAYGLCKPVDEKVQEQFEVHHTCGLESDYITDLFERTVPMNYTKIEPAILEEVLLFCQRRANIKLSDYDEEYKQDLLNAFDKEFLSKHPKSLPILAKFLRAACELKIKSLLDLTSDHIVNHVLINRKSNRDMLKLFHLKKYFTVKEMKRALQLKSWVVESLD